MDADDGQDFLKRLHDTYLASFFSSSLDLLTTTPLIWIFFFTLLWFIHGHILFLFFFNGTIVLSSAYTQGKRKRKGWKRGKNAQTICFVSSSRRNTGIGNKDIDIYMKDTLRE